MFIFLDTETTGTGPDDKFCYIAFKPEVGPAVYGLLNSGMPITIDAMAIHHINNKMVEDKPPFKGSPEYQKLSELIDDPLNVVVAHNARFDVEMMKREGLYPKHVICTLKLDRQDELHHYQIDKACHIVV